ncbi:MAG: hypothetical protein ACM3X4_07525 [Ignavibacteriales bacterium]
MRAGLVFNQVFWGVFLIVLGVLAILKTVFNLHFSLFRVALSVFFIYIGISILLGGPGYRGDRDTVLFDHRTISVGDYSDKYNVIFGSGIVDASAVRADTAPVLEVNVIFSRGVLRIDPASPVRVVLNSAFGSGTAPDGSVVNFGTHTYRSPAYKEGERHVEIRASVVFGALDVVAH